MSSSSPRFTAFVNELGPLNEDDDQQSGSLNAEAQALLDQYKQDWDPVHLERVVDRCRDVLRHRRSGRLRATALLNISHAFLTRLEYNSNVDTHSRDLCDAITCSRELLQSLPGTDEQYPQSLGNIGSLLFIRFERKGAPSDLSDAIAFQKEALALRPPGHESRSDSLHNLAGAVWTRFMQDITTPDLVDAITYLQEALRLRSHGHLRRSDTLNDIGVVLLIRFRHEGCISDLSGAISQLREATDLRPPQHPRRSESLSNLANGLRTRFEREGNLVDLTESIIHHREALNLRPPGHPCRLYSLTNFAVSLGSRFGKEGNPSDLEDMIALQREALHLAPSGLVVRAIIASNLGFALTVRYQQEGGLSYLLGAIDSYREALSLRFHGHSSHSDSLRGLGSVLRTRFELERNPDDLTDAIAYQREALVHSPPGNVRHSQCLDDLAESLRIQFEQTGDLSDLLDALRCHRKALDSSPRDYLWRSKYLCGLALGLARYMQYRDETQHQLRQSDIHIRDPAITQSSVISLLHEASLAQTSFIRDRLRASSEWIRLARHYHHQSLMEAYRTTLTLSDTTIARASSLEARHARLTNDYVHRRAYGLANDAAACAIDLNDLNLAVEVVEHGRATLLSQLRQYRTSLDVLHAVDQKLVARFASLSQELERSVISEDTLRVVQETGPSFRDGVARYQRTAAEWEETVQQIRAVDGFQSFLRPAPFRELQRAADNGPVIIVNISKNRSDALIVTSEGPPLHVELPDATLPAVQQLSQDLTRYRVEADSRILLVLRRLWELIVGPIVPLLQSQLALPRGSRIWWCATSVACRLPLHAAGTYRPGSTNLPDLYVSSYTPTLGALLSTRTSPLESSGTPSILIVGQEDTPGQDALVNVRDEIKRIQGLAPHANVLDGSHSTRAAILDAVTQHSWVHFACHGKQLSRPFRSNFALYDQPLSLLDIVEKGLPHAELAVLSACHSAAGDEAAPDEVLHLTAAMQFAGFRSVVGTLWAMADDDGPLLAGEFYKHMLRRVGEPVDYTEAAVALSRAVRVLRKNGVPAWRWINFVHYGA